MHVAFVNNTRKWGGVKTWSLAMAKSLQDAGHQSSVLGQDPVFIEKALSMGLNAVRRPVGPDYNPMAIAFYRAFFSRHAVDAVVVNVGKDIRSAGIAARIRGIPMIHRVGAPRDFRSTIQTRLESNLLRPHYLCCSQYVLDLLQVSVPHVGRFMKTAIHPGTPVPVLLPERNRGGEMHIITTSRLSSDKRHAELLEALCALRDEGFLFRLTIVGDGDERPALETLTRQKRLEDRVRFTGFTTDVSARLKEADIFVLPTWCEPLGIALEEAMAQGLVPVARNAGGVPEIWPEGLEYLLVEQKSGARGFAVALRSLISLSRESFDALRVQVHAHAGRCFDQKEQFRKFYAWVLDVQAAMNSRAS